MRARLAVKESAHGFKIKNQAVDVQECANRAHVEVDLFTRLVRLWTRGQAVAGDKCRTPLPQVKGVTSLTHHCAHPCGQELVELQGKEKVLAEAIWTASVRGDVDATRRP